MEKYSMLYPRSTATRRVLDLNGMWKFRLDKKGEGDAENWKDGIPNADWIPVPASFNDFYTDKESREFTGDFWYETQVYVPSEWKGRHLDVRFAAVTHRAVVYINGVAITSHEGGFLQFCARMDDVVKWDAPNRIVVKGNNELSFTSLPAGITVDLGDGRKMTKPFFDFFNYAGIQRPVKLMASPMEQIVDVTLNHRLEGADAFVEYSVETTGDHETVLFLYDEDGNLAAESRGKEGVLTVSNARLWEVRNAYLYHLVIRILDGDRVVDEYFDDIGIRTFCVDGNRFLLNGHPVYLKGFGKHEDSDIVGRGFNIGVVKRDFELMKWIGANSFRTSHYPYSEEIYQMADREGFLVIDEVAAVGFFESLVNFVDAVSGKATTFFSRPTLPQLKANHLAALEELITRDKNHACVIAWSLFNEPDTMHENAYPYFKDIFARARELDAQKRPCTFAMELNSSPEKCHCYQLSDFLCFNRYYGWYLLGGYEMVNAEAAFRKELDAWLEKGVTCPFVFTEYGCDHLAGEHKLPSVQWSVEYEQEYLDLYHRVFDSYDCIKGEQIWNFADFQTVEGIMRVNGNKKGVFTRQRQPKETAYILKKRWEHLPVDYKG